MHQCTSSWRLTSVLMSWLVHELMNNEELTSNLTGGLRHKLTRELMDE